MTGERGSMRAALPLVLTLLGCSRSPGQRPPADSTAPPALPVASPAASPNRELVQPAVLPAALSATCDTAAALVREALTLELKREDGSGGEGVCPAGLETGSAIYGGRTRRVGLQSPPYLEGDFDGDEVNDAAVLVEHRATGKLGVAIVHRGTRRVSILGAGSGSAGPGDLSWIDRWDLYRKGVSFSLTIQDRPSIQLGADALWVGRQDSVSAFYIWTGANYIWEAHPRTAGQKAGAFIGTSIRPTASPDTPASGRIRP